MVLWVTYLLVTVPFTYTFGIIVSDMSYSIGLSMTLAAGGYTCYQLSNALISPFAGKLIVKLGPKKVLLVGCAFMIFAAVMMAYFVNSVILYYFVWIVLFSIGMRCAGLMALQTVLSNWFFQKRSLAMSLLLTAGGIGGYIFTPVLNYINKAYSWNAVWLTIAVLNALTLVMLLLFLRETPAELNQEIDNGLAISEKKNSTRKKRGYKTKEAWTLKETVRTPVFYFLIVVFLTASYLMVSVGNYALNHLTLTGCDSAKAAKAIGYFALINTVGRLMIGALDGRMSMKYIAMAGAVVSIVGNVLMLKANNFGTVVTALICIGIGYGILIVSAQTLLVDYFGTAHYSEINGVFGMASGILSALPTVIIGFLFDQFGNYNSAWILGLGLSALTVLCMLLTRPPRHFLRNPEVNV